MLSAVLATIAARALLRRGDRVVVAVSGGPDSMALLHVLWELRARLDLSLGYLRRRSIPFAEDPSNADPRFARARIRHAILPALARENPRVGEALRALAAAARGDGVVEAAASSLSRRAAATVARLVSRG